MIKINVKQLHSKRELEQWYGEQPDHTTPLDLSTDEHWEVAVDETVFLMYRHKEEFLVLHGNHEPAFDTFGKAIDYCIEWGVTE